MGNGGYRFLGLAWVSLGALVSGVARGEGPPADQTSMDLYRSAYFLGRGDTGIAIADDEEAIFYNPAGIAQGKGIYKKTVLVSPQVEFSVATRDLVRKLTSENADPVSSVRQNIGTPNHLGVRNVTALVFRRVAIGAIHSSNINLLAYKSPADGGLEAVRAAADQSLGLTFSLAERFFSDRLYLGVTGKYLARARGFLEVGAAQADQLSEKLKDKNQFLGYGQGSGCDLGLMYKVPSRVPWSLGVTIQDVGDTNIIPEGDTSLDLDLKQTINIGLAIEPGTRTSTMRFLFDYRDVAQKVETNPRKKIHIGTELSVFDAIGVTGGLNQGYPTAGIYLDAYVFRLDLSYYTEEVGARAGERGDARYVMRLKAGF